MTAYPFEAWTRVALPPTIAHLESPKVHEIGVQVGSGYTDGYEDPYYGHWSWPYDITCELTRDGLVLPKRDTTIDQTPWYGGMEVEVPTRVGTSGAELRGYRHIQPDPELLWDVAIVKTERNLVVRRGVPVDDDWAAGQVVEVYRFVFGTRAVIPSAKNTTTQFTVPLFIYEQTDSAVLVR